jgi:hypothetical protein
MEKRVALPPSFRSIEDFKINSHTLFSYHSNKVLDCKVYYRCSKKECPAKASALIEKSEIVIMELGDHNHPPPQKKIKEHHQSIVSFTKKHIAKTPSKIQLEFIRENGDAPPLRDFQLAKSNLRRG